MIVFRAITGWQRNLVWFLFAILFYFSGQSFSIWLLEPENFTGGLEWILVASFPLLLPTFFYINSKFGCASGACVSPHSNKAKTTPAAQHQECSAEIYRRPPGG